ncbi:hypothetical protein ACJMK2_021050 [Sinanodonta woodiana]|uniref:Uncharacterized protein n=1 Tax=Sinanodonta woodiana TaxID=1069815 RepID=A0ABD3U406_SINWO
MAAKENKVTSSEAFDCPIYLEQFKVPTSLPCLHTFCLKCLKSYIAEKIVQAGDVDMFICQICRQEVKSPHQETQSSEWAKTFPVNRLIASMLPDSQLSLQPNCDSCTYDGTLMQAGGFCLVCKEHLCDECIKFHRKTKVLREHKIVNLEELSQNSEIGDYLPIKTEMCPVHVDEENKFFCKDHKGLFCSSCTFMNHRTCKNVFDLKLHSKALLEMFEPSLVSNKFDTLVTQLKEVTKEKETSLQELRFQVDHVMDDIKNLRQKMNTLFDEAEMEVRSEGNRIYKEVSMTLLDQKQECQSLIVAIQNSKTILDTVFDHGSENQVFSVLLEMEEQLDHYNKTVDKYKRAKSKSEVRLELDSRIKTIGDLKWSDLFAVSYCVNPPVSSSSFKIGKNDLVTVLKLNEFSSNLSGFSSAFLSDDKFVLVEFKSKKCCMYGPTFEKVTECFLRSFPSAVCKAGDTEFAVTLPTEKKIQFFTSDSSMKPTRFIKTNLACCGLGIFDNTIITTYLSNRYLYLAVLHETGEEACKVKLDECNTRNYSSCIVIDKTRIRAYITCYDTNTLYIFSLSDGANAKIYKSTELQGPDGIAIDGDGNVYVVGSLSNNIHQLSAEGRLIRVITEDVPLNPSAISFNESGNKLVLTAQGSVCYIFKQIYKEI